MKRKHVEWMMMWVAAALGGCVNVATPDKPIVINLNIKITADVVVKLDKESQKVIQQNPGIF